MFSLFDLKLWSYWNMQYIIYITGLFGILNAYSFCEYWCTVFFGTFWNKYVIKTFILLFTNDESSEMSDDIF